MKISITKAAVEALAFPEKGQAYYYDTKLPGFGVVCSKTCKTYFAEGKVGGKTIRTSIGRHGVFFPDRARDEARELLVRMSKGENPNSQAAADRRTVKSLLDAYLSERTTGHGLKLKDKTSEGYKWLRDVPLAPWADEQLAALDEALVRKIHKKVTEERGPVVANNALRMLRAALNFHDVSPNPVEVLSKKKLWNPDKRRSRFIEAEGIEEWIKAAEGLSPVMRGAVLCMLLLGFRKMEALTLTKKQYRNGCLYVGETKNGDDHMVPVGPYLKARLDPLLKLEGPWLFPSPVSDSGHVMDPRDAIASLGKKVSAHDLRRTFVSHLNALEPAPSVYTIKRLMNHRPRSSDVTAGYIQIEERTLRDVVTRLESRMVGTS